MSYTDMEQYWIWLSSVAGIGPKSFYRLLAEYEDPREVWSKAGAQMTCIAPKTRERLLAARNEQYLYGLFAKLDRLGIRAVTRISDAYPQRLMHIHEVPPVLYIKGAGNLSQEKMIAIVGTRAPTYDGKRAARDIAKGLSEHGVTVVSGLARGTDTCAHKGALEGGTPTVGVIGCGLDVVYPAENDRLYAEMLERGGTIVSEYLPGTQPLSQHFPARNRIISGLCPGVVIVEADERSGAMITARLALEQNRDVFAVPGSIYSKLSAETNRLLVQGAAPALGAWEVLEYYDWAQRGAGTACIPIVDLTEEEYKVAEPLQSEMLSFDELSEKTKFPPARLNSLLTTLELRGIINKVPGGGYRATDISVRME